MSSFFLSLFLKDLWKRFISPLDSGWYEAVFLLAIPSVLQTPIHNELVNCVPWFLELQTSKSVHSKITEYCLGSCV
uniref:Uncharacterized protein n=1 Tax=Lepeophtheirus salmonis TaxID=72036 RepID=A0A0K2TSN7_LEPSM